MTAYANVDGHTLLSVKLCIPNIGPWWADVVFEAAPDVEGSVSLVVGELTLSGTIRTAGTFGLQRSARIVAGAGGWGELVEASHYHSDSGVSARTVAEDAARLVGESLGSFNPGAAIVGVDYARQSGAASRVLEDVIGGVPWYVDYDGLTQVGARTSGEVDASSYEVISVDPKEELIVLGVDDLSSVVVGSVVSERLDVPVTIHELRIEVNADQARVVGFFGGSLTSRGRLAGLMKSLVKRATEERLFGLYEFRVVSMSSDRVELQSVEPGVSGLSDARPISMRPGAPGCHGELTPGTLVLVQFINGLRTRPVITQFEGKDGEGWTPANLTFDAATAIKLGQNATKFVALAEDTKARLDTLQNAHDTHKHPTAPTGPTSLPDVLVGPLGSIAANKVQAE